MAIKSRHQLAKEQAINRKEKGDLRRKASVEYSHLDEISKLEIRAGHLLSQIKNCEADLSGPFKRNEVIQSKMEGLIELRDSLLLQVTKLKEVKNEEQGQTETQVV
jgi:hypothetical protein